MHNFKYILLLLLVTITVEVKAQEPYNNCKQAIELCPNKSYTLNNIDATATVCNNCEDDFNFCFSGTNSIWMTFTTNQTGGNVNAVFSNIIFENIQGQGSGLQAMIIQATIPCISSSYSLVSNCIADATGFTLIADSLLANTTYYIVVNGTTGTNSYAEATFDLILNGEGIERNTVFSIWTPSTTICNENTVTIYAHTEFCENISVFNWYINGDFITSTLDSMFVFSNFSDNDIVSAEVSCFDQCRDTLTSNSLTFTVTDFMVDAGADFTILNGESVQLQGQTTESIISWSPSENMNNSSVINPIVIPNETTTYFLTVSNGICSITDETTIFVINNLKIPSLFSPNGDGINDTWEILGIEEYPNCNIRVFSRWGQLVFQTTGYSKQKRWEGTSKSGRELSEGAYYYVINLRDKQNDQPLKGTVSIIR